MSFSVPTLKADAAALDRELAGRVSAYLASRHLPTLRHLQVEVHEGVVTLRGRVRTFHEKQLSQLSGRRVAGVRQLIDEIDVVPSASESPSDRRDVVDVQFQGPARTARPVDFFSL
jgi:osmotically-inducible protein OsmY